MYFVFVFALLLLPGPSCSNSDKLAFLLDTLKTVHRAVCDDEMVYIECPKTTAISIQVAQYGTTMPENSVCTASSVDQRGKENNCKRNNAMQYSLLQTVIEACQKKRNCTFSTKPKPDIEDPCPYARVYVEMSYKCRPNEFLSVTACENDVVKLNCKPHTRIAIFDAQYGRTPYEPACVDSQGVADESCSTPFAIEKVMQVCLGKRRCQIVANNRNFESYCSPQTRPYLKVVYACVPLGIISERYESAAEMDELDGRTKIVTDDLVDKDGSGEKWGDTSIGSPIADPALQPPMNDITPTPNQIEDTAIMTSKPNIEKTTELTSSQKLYMFSGIAIIIFVILIAIFIGIRCYLEQKAKNDSKNGDMFTTEAPNVFNDAVSDIDNDVDVSHISGTFYDPVHPDMILFKDGGNRGTIRAMKPLSTIYPIAGASMYGNVDYVPTQTRDIPTRFTRSRSKEEQSSADMMMSPKSLTSYANSQYYYG